MKSVFQHLVSLRAMALALLVLTQYAWPGYIHNQRDTEAGSITTSYPDRFSKTHTQERDKRHIRLFLRLVRSSDFYRGRTPNYQSTQQVNFRSALPRYESMSSMAALTDTEEIFPIPSDKV